MHLREWYDKVSLEFEKARFSREKCREILESANLALRQFFPEFMRHCKQRGVPFYIVSGGINMVSM